MRIFLWRSLAFVACGSFCWQSTNALLMTMSTTTSNTNQLLVVGLNGALQKRFVIADSGNLSPGKVHRASQVQTGVGGKGQDVAIALGCLDAPGVRLLQFLGSGAEGDAVNQLLQDQLGEETIQETTIRVASALRTCTSIVGSDDTTELVEPSGEIGSDELQRLLDKCQDLKSSTTGICVMGSMPPGCPATTYADIYQRAATPSTLCVVDSVAGIAPMFEQLVGPTVFKINVHELASLAGVSEETDLPKTIQAFFAKFQPPEQHLQALAITDGKRPGHLCCLSDSSTTPGMYDFELYQLGIPKLDGGDTTLYPIGAGDAVAAGTLAAWIALQPATKPGTVPSSCESALESWFQSLPNTFPEKEKMLLSAFAFGLACGSASCLQEENSVLDSADVLRLLTSLETPSKL